MRDGEATSLFQRAADLQLAGRLAEAIELYERALERDGDFAEAHNNLGTALQTLGQLERALSHYDRAIALSPSNASAYDNRGSALQMQGAFAEAIAFHERAIELDPGMPQAHHHLGNALLRLRRQEDALVPLRRALALRPDYKETLNCLGTAQQATGALDEAIVSYQKALALSPDYAEAYCNLGTAQQAIGALDEAIASYRKALALAPDYADVHGNLGAALREAGDFDAATEHFTRAVALEPRNGRFHRLLATEVSVRPVEESHLRQMEALADEIDSLTIDHRIELRFALAKAYADYGDYPRSFENLRDANALKRSTIEYDEAETLGAFEALPKLFAKPLIQAMAGCGDPSSKPVFIFGMPRSGTTLVEQVLAAHPQVYTAGELGAFEKAMRGFSPIDADPRNASTFAALLAEQLRNVGARYAREVEALSPSAARVTDKWPWSFKFAGIIHLALPNARMIHVQRDPLDTCFSCFFTLFTDDVPYMYDLGELGRYYRGYQRLMAYWREALPQGAILEVQYEELIDDFERQARRLIEHCGLEWDDACIDFSSVKRPVRTASAVAVRQPLYRSAIGRAEKYRDYLSPLQAALGL